jgi:hypothetical protein
VARKLSNVATIAIAIISSGAFTTIITAIIDAIKRRKSKKSGIEARLERIERKLDVQEAQLKKNEQHNDLQYLSLLRLTVMDSDMPMSERLIAGKEYLSRGGNGEVKAYYHTLEESVNK